MMLTKINGKALEYRPSIQVETGTMLTLEIDIIPFNETTDII